jgi:hypothetical protein
MPLENRLCLFFRKAGVMSGIDEKEFNYLVEQQ